MLLFPLGLLVLRFFEPHELAESLGRPMAAQTPVSIADGPLDAREQSAGRFVALERSLLQRVYGFDRWHVGHAGEAYAADIVRYLNAWPRRRSRGRRRDRLRPRRHPAPSALPYARRPGSRSPAPSRPPGSWRGFRRAHRPRFEVFEFPGAS